MVASLTIRNIPDEVKRRFRQIAAAHGRSMEEHLRRLIVDAADEREAASAAVVRDRTKPFDHGSKSRAVPTEGDWAEELARIAKGAGEGVFEPEPQPLREFDL